MEFSPQEIDVLTQSIRNRFNTEITWKYEERSGVMLSEFSQMTQVKVLAELQSLFPDVWDYKSIKTAPIDLFEPLGDFNKLTQKQLIFSQSSTNNEPTLIAVLWPWGHGGTFSLRIKPLKNSYNMADIRPNKLSFSYFKSLFQNKTQKK